MGSIPMGDAKHLLIMDKDKQEKLLHLKQQSLKRCIELLEKAIKEGTVKRIGTAKFRKLRNVD